MFDVERYNLIPVQRPPVSQFTYTFADPLRSPKRCNTVHLYVQIQRNVQKCSHTSYATQTVASCTNRSTPIRGHQLRYSTTVNKPQKQKNNQIIRMRKSYVLDTGEQGARVKMATTRQLRIRERTVNSSEPRGKNANISNNYAPSNSQLSRQRTAGSDYRSRAPIHVHT